MTARRGARCAVCLLYERRRWPVVHFPLGPDTDTTRCGDRDNEGQEGFSDDYTLECDRRGRRDQLRRPGARRQGADRRMQPPTGQPRRSVADRPPLRYGDDRRVDRGARPLRPAQPGGRLRGDPRAARLAQSHRHPTLPGGGRIHPQGQPDTGLRRVDPLQRERAADRPGPELVFGILRQDRGRIRAAGRPTRHLYRYILPNEWALVP